jgi:2-phosphosulfolactate phosphatase
MEIKILSALKGIHSIPVSEYIHVVIDVLRASSTILCLMENGAEEVKVVETPEEALQFKDKGYILVGERGDQFLEGFDFDNSPYAVKQHCWQGKRVVVTTTNGTRALYAVRQGFEVVVGGFRNINAVAEYLKERDRPIAIIPIGNLGEPRIEDELCAIALRSLIQGKSVEWERINREILEEKANKIHRLGENYRKDVELSLTVNATRIIPTLGENLALYKQEYR